LLSGSLMDCALPRADDFTAPVSECDESRPCLHYPLRAKGCGEAGAIAAPAALLSAVLDALRPLFTDIEMPITPARLWSAIAAAAGGGGPIGSADLLSGENVRRASPLPGRG
jgi:carbon-monoxide dehydrogenase large subunit